MVIEFRTKETQAQMVCSSFEPKVVGGKLCGYVAKDVTKSRPDRLYLSEVIEIVEINNEGDKSLYSKI